MKKITFILLALISGTAFAQSASADGIVNANIVSTLTIEAGADLNFGDITPNQGIVVVNPTGYDSGATTANVIGNVPTPGTFVVNAADTFAYTVTLPGTVVLSTAGGANLTLKNLEHNSTETGTGSDDTFSVGGTLYVADSQAVGTYSGTVTVSVAYN